MTDLKELDQVFQHIDDNFTDHLNKVQQFLKTPCFSTEDVGVKENVAHLQATMERLQFHHIDIVDMPRGNPVVFGEYKANADKTILVYAKYDNVGVEEKNWTYDPYKAEIADNPPYGKCIFARGAHGGHSQPQAFFNSLEAIIKTTGGLPVNIMYVLEGDEELGSFNLPQFVQQYQDLLKRADVMISPGAASQDKQGKLKLQLGGPGIMYVEFECSAEHWGRGPAKFDIHPSSSPIVDSPLWYLIKAVGSMASNDGKEILIDGFYNDVVEPTPVEDRNLDELSNTFDVPKEMEARGGVKQFTDNETDPKVLLKQLLYHPTTYVTRLTTKLGILPSKAQAEMTFRLKPNQSMQEMLKLVRTHLDNNGFSAITFKQLGGYDWWKTNPKEPIAQAVIKSYEYFGIKPEIWHIGSGGDPIAVFNRPPLSLPSVGNVALAHGAGGHSPDEYMVVEGNPPYMGLKELEKSYAMILYEYANHKD